MQFALNTLLTVFLFFVLNIVSVGFQNIKVDEWKLLFAYFLLFVIIYIFKIKKVVKTSIFNKKTFFVLIWLGLSISVMISKIINDDEINNALLLCFLIPIFFVNILPKIQQSKELVTYSAAVSYLPLVILLFYIVSVNGRDNSIGVLTSFTGAIILMIINNKLSNRNKTFVIGAFGILFFLLIFINGSRTGLIAFVVVFIYTFRKSVIESSINFKGKFLILHSFVTIILLGSLLFYNNLSGLLINKWNGTSDITSGREIIWLETIKEMSLFGFGSEYFYQKFFIGDAHNIFIQVLGEYGTITATIFLIFVIYLMILVIRVRNTNYNIIFMSYFILGLFENVLLLDFRFGTITFIIWSYIGFLLNERVEKTPKSLVI